MLQVARMAAKHPEQTFGFGSHNSFAPNSWPAKLKKSLKIKIFVA